MSQLTISSKNAITYGQIVSNAKTQHNILLLTLKSLPKKVVDIEKYTDIAIDNGKFVDEERNKLLPILDKVIKKYTVLLQHKINLVNNKVDTFPQESQTAKKRVHRKQKKCEPEPEYTYEQGCSYFKSHFDKNIVINYLKLKLCDNVYIREYTEHNNVFQPSFRCDLLKQYMPESSFHKFVGDKDKITVDEFIDHIINPPANYTKSRFHVYIPFHIIFFNLKNDPKYQIVYKCDEQIYKAILEKIRPRAENIFADWIFRMVANCKYLNDLNPYDFIKTQVNYEGKKGKYYDFQFFDNILLEYQEKTDSHTDNPDDLDKKMIAIRNNNVAIYIKQKDVQHNERLKLTEFWQDELLSLLIAKRSFNNDAYVLTYLENRFFELKKQERDDAEKKLTLTDKTNVKLYKSLNNKTKMLEAALEPNMSGQLKTIFQWKKNSVLSTGTTDKVIKLNDVLRTIRMVESNPDYGEQYDKLLDLYCESFETDANENYMINWETLLQIVGRFCNENDGSRDTLMSFLSTVDRSYLNLMKMREKYHNLKDEQTEELKKFDINRLGATYKAEIKKLENEIIYSAKRIEMKDESFKLQIGHYGQLNEFTKDLIKNNNIVLNNTDKSFMDNIMHNLELVKTSYYKYNDENMFVKNTVNDDNHNNAPKIPIKKNDNNVIKNNVSCFTNNINFPVVYDDNTENIIIFSEFHSISKNFGFSDRKINRYVRDLLGDDNIEIHPKLELRYLKVMKNLIVNIKPEPYDENNENEFDSDIELDIDSGNELE